MATQLLPISCSRIVPRSIAAVLALTLAVTLSGGLAHAAIISVDCNGGGDYLTIQEGIDAAVNGDTVLVAPGTYRGSGNRDLDFYGKAIVVMSSHGPEATIIDAENSARGFQFQSGETDLSILAGFTVTNGSASQGGGIYVYCSDPTITDCIVRGNTAVKGGGIYSQGDWGSNYSSPTITHCTIADNTTRGVTLAGDGGGIYAVWGFPRISHCLIEGNAATDVYDYADGGGVFLGYYGLYGSGPQISHCTFKDNSADDRGGGVYYTEIQPSFQPYSYTWGCRFTGNTADSGAGVFVDDSQISIYNCLFDRNQTTSCGTCRGGGIFFFECHDALVHSCTLVENYGNQGGAIYDYSSSVAVYNCILYGNNTDQILGSPNDTTVTYSDVEGGWVGIGNIDADPLFASTTNGDYHLTWPSPCRNAGNNSDTPSSDFEGDPRIRHGTVDMGADEFCRHLYCTGDFRPGGSIQLKFVGLPGTSPVGLFIGVAELDPPMTTPWGDFFIASPPLYVIAPLGFIPSDGIMVLPTTIPATVPAPYDVYLQALIGLNSDSLTNLEVLEVR